MYDRLTAHAPPIDRARLRRILARAVTVRNSVSHGAVVALDEPTLDVIARVFLEAIRILVDAGMHHMVGEGAWFRWQDLRRWQDGFDVDDWLAAERTMRHWVVTKGRTPTV